MSLLERLQAKRKEEHGEQQAPISNRKYYPEHSHTKESLEGMKHSESEQHNGYFMRGENLYNYARRNNEGFSGQETREELEALIRSINNSKKESIENQQEQVKVLPKNNVREEEDFYSQALEADFDFQNSKNKEVATTLFKEKEQVEKPNTHMYLNEDKFEAVDAPQGNKEQTPRVESNSSADPSRVITKQATENQGEMDQDEAKNIILEFLLNERKGDDVESIIGDLDSIIEEIQDANGLLNGNIDLYSLKEEMKNDLAGYGPITPLLADENVTEVMVNGPNQVFVERDGNLELSDVTFRDNQHVQSVIERIVAPLGRRIDESSPMVDARLKDGSRVNAIIPPLSLVGPTITIRKFAKDPYTIHDLINFGTLSKEMAIFLKACVQAKLNIFVSGGTGSGKTTTLNVLSSFISNNDRIVTIEDAAELQLGQEHIVSLETRPPNIEGKGAVTIRDLVRNSLRMRPDRIVIGEVRSGEALDMLQAMNTGHDGSLATGHSNSPRDMVARLETMVLMAGMDLPLRAIREQIAGAIDVIVQQARLRDGTRRITNITEVQGMEGDVIVLQDIFTFRQYGVEEDGKIIGKLEPTGIRPKFYELMEDQGIYLPPSIFAQSME